MRRISRASALLCALGGPALFVSCRSDRAPATGVVRGDSAGIAIVESRAPAALANAIQLSVEPAVTIGAAETDSTQLIDGVVSAVRLSDGRIVIANRLPPMLRWYDADGRFLHGVGSVGGGPGDFSGEGLGIGGMWRIRGDSIAAWDILRRRMQVFDAQGKYARAFSPKPPPGWRQFFAPRVVGIHADSILIASVNVSSGPPATADMWRDSAQYAQWRLDGEYQSELARLPGVESYSPAFQQRVRGPSPSSPGAPPPPPGPPNG